MGLRLILHSLLGPALARLCPTSLANSNVLGDAVARKGHGFARTSLVKDLSAVSAVVLSIRECELGSTSHTDIRVDPCWRGGRV
jgi:hypothetical protein